MKDVIKPLRKAYIAALASVGCPVYYQQLPNTVSPNEYILISIPSNSNDSDKHLNGTEVTVRVGIYTQAENINNGIASTTIAEAVYAAILPTPTATLTLDNMQMLTTTLQSDTEENFSIKNTIVYIDRFINFTHKINHQ